MFKPFTAEDRFACGLDGLVAGIRWAYAAVLGDAHPAALGVVIESEPGYHPIPELWAHADTLEAMQAHADALNLAEGLDARAAAQIVASSMRPAARRGADV